MIRSVLVPLDGSTFGEHALPLALGVARRAGAVLHLVHVHQIIPPATVGGVAIMDNLEMTLKEEERAYLTGVAERLRKLAPIEVRIALLEGDVVSALQARMQQVATDLVVMGTHGRGALGRFWLGSVTDELVRQVHVPLLLVRPRDEKPDLTAEPLKHFLLPLDGTSVAEQILKPALELGALMGADYTLMQAIKPAVRPSYLPEGSTLEGMTHSVLEKIEHQQRHLNEDANRYLEGVAARVRKSGAVVKVRSIVEENPATAILREAQVEAADLIAVETHGRRGLSRWLLGGVADKVIRGATLPVLVHRPLP
jgi:nucleotide-binding universal stress UspA family protein